MIHNSDFFVDPEWRLYFWVEGGCRSAYLIKNIINPNIWETKFTITSLSSSKQSGLCLINLNNFIHTLSSYKYEN